MKEAVKHRIRRSSSYGRLAPLLVAVLSLSLGAFRHDALVIAQNTPNVFEETTPSALPVATVYDNVLSKEKAEWLHTLCSEWNDSTKQHNEEENHPHNPNPKDILFEFPLQHPEKHAPIQRFLNHLIWQMVARDENENKGESPPKRYYVEYWTRQEWHHILAHQDMDEGWERLLRKERQECFERNSQASVKDDAHLHQFEDCRKNSQNFKHPIAGQVLYLQVGSKVRGPTVVFDAANGGDLMGIHTAKSSKTSTSDKNGNAQTMVSVPAVEGRLLRFGGDRLHAVPRPHDVYWTFDQSQNHIHTKDYERSVLLFNLWNHSADSFLMDKVLDCGDGKFPADRTTCYTNRAKSDDEKLSMPPQAGINTCNPQTEWNHVPVVHRPNAPQPQEPQDEASFFSLLWDFIFGTSISQQSFQVPLLGDAYKRGISGYVARMLSSSWWENEKHVHPARDNLGEAHLPTWTEIEADERFAAEEKRREL